MFTDFSRTILLLLGFILLISSFTTDPEIAWYALICFLVDFLFMGKYRVFFK